MNLAETAKLIVQMDLGGNLTKELTKVKKQFAEIDQQVNGRISGGLKTIGAGLTVAFIRGAAIAVGALGGITGAIAAMAKEGEDATKSQILFDTAVANSGKITAQYVTSLQAQQLALMNLAGVNDQLIEQEQTKLIQFGLTGDQVEALTPLILDYAIATGTDLLTATEQVGKATQGFTSTLTQNGVVIDKAKAKIDPYAATIEALNDQYRGTAQALSGELTTKLNVFHEALANIRAEAGIRLLPALTRIVDIAGTKLVPAFGKFIERIMPALIKGINDFADILESGGVEKGINAITDAVGPMITVLKLAVGPVQALVKAFLALPQKVQAGLISGFLINKLSGGLVAQGGKDVLGGVGSLAGPSIGAGVGAILGKLGFTRGTSPANPLYVWVQNRAANGQFATGGTTKLTTAGSILSKVFIVGEAIGLVAAVNDVRSQIADQLTQQSEDIKGQTDTWLKQTPKREDLVSGLAAVDKGISDIMMNPLNVFIQGDALDNLKKMRQDIAAQLALWNSLGGLLYQGGGRPEIDDVIPRKPGMPKAPGTPRATEDRGAYVAVKVTQSIKDVNTAQDIRGRWSPTASQAGAA